MRNPFWRKPQQSREGGLGPDEFREIERRLSLRLPEAYRHAVAELTPELQAWPPAPGGAESAPFQEFLLSVDEVLDAQKGARKRLGRALPRHGFVFGKCGNDYWMLDASQDPPPVKLVFDGMLLDGHDSPQALLESIRSRHAEAWRKHRLREEAGEAASLAPDALVIEGRRLARPTLLLVEEGEGAPVASWRGEGVAPPPEGDWEHWISLDASSLPENPRGLGGVLSVYLSGEDGETIVVAHDPGGTVSAAGGTPLYGLASQSLPTIEALLHFGGERIQAWRRANSIDPGFHPSALSEGDREAFRTYHRLLQSEHLFFTHGAYAMLGGWSFCFLWCYGIDEEYPWDLMRGPLVVMTVRDSEPWLEVFDTGSEFVGFSRIT